MTEEDRELFAKSGIYQIRNTANDRVYVGQSVNMLRRFADHRKLLRRGAHYNGRLQNAWSKYGEDSFVLEVICYCEGDDLDRIEEEQIRGRQLTDDAFGYNICWEGRNGSRRGLKNSPEARARISAAKMGKPGAPHTDQSREAIRVAHLGKPKSAAHRANLSAANKGKPPPNTGIAHSEEAKGRMRAAKATVEWQGQMVTMRQLEELVGRSRQTIAYRMKLGMTLEEAATGPMQRIRRPMGEAALSSP
jgi:group I intron endonuclease